MNYDESAQRAIKWASGIAKDNPGASLVACEASEHGDEPDRLQLLLELSTGHLNSFGFEPDAEHNLDDREGLETGLAAAVALAMELTRMEL